MDPLELPSLAVVHGLEITARAPVLATTEIIGLIKATRVLKLEIGVTKLAVAAVELELPTSAKVTGSTVVTKCLKTRCRIELSGGS